MAHSSPPDELPTSQTNKDIASSFLSCLTSCADVAPWRRWQASQRVRTIAALTIVHARNATRLVVTAGHDVSNTVWRIANFCYVHASSFDFNVETPPRTVQTPREAAHMARVCKSNATTGPGAAAALASRWLKAVCAIWTMTAGSSRANCWLLYWCVKST